MAGFWVIGPHPRDQAGAAVARRPRLAFLVARQAGQDRLALGRNAGGALRHDQRVRQRLGHVGKQFLHRLDRLDPPLLRRARTIGLSTWVELAMHSMASCAS
jgi:hypothetical protein